jgi:hypothetical protein
MDTLVSRSPGCGEVTRHLGDVPPPRMWWSCTATSPGPSLERLEPLGPTRLYASELEVYAIPAVESSACHTRR